MERAVGDVIYCTSFLAAFTTGDNILVEAMLTNPPPMIFEPLRMGLRAVPKMLVGIGTSIFMCLGDAEGLRIGLLVVGLSKLVLGTV